MTAGAALALLLAAAPAPASSDGRLVFGTRSEEAAAAAREAMQVLVRTRSLSAVEALAQKAVDADREFAFARCLLAIGFQGSSREAADVQTERARDLAPAAPEGEQRWVAAFLLRGRRDEAIVAWKKLAAAYPQEPLVFVSLGELYLDRHDRGPSPADSDLDDAHEAFETALSLDPKSAVAHARLASLSTRRGDHAHAREHLEWAREAMGPAASGCRGVASRLELARAHLFDGNPSEARALVRQCRDELLQAPRVDGGTWNLIGRVLLETGDAESGLAAYEKGREWIEKLEWSEDEQALRQVWVGRYHHGRGRSLAKLGKHAEAWAEVETVKKMIDGGGDAATRYLPSYHYLAGYVKLEAGDARVALEHLEQASASGDAFRTLLLARAHEKLGRTNEARRLYREIVEAKDLDIERALSYAEAKARLAALEGGAARRP
jgi:tetratricopeptide (TPR) repeat protein